MCAAALCVARLLQLAHFCLPSTPTTAAADPPACNAQVDVKLSVRGNPRGRGTEAHHQREQIVEVTCWTLR